MERRQASSSSSSPLTSAGHCRRVRPVPKARRKQMPNANATKGADANDVAYRDQIQLVEGRQQRLVSKDSIRNGVDQDAPKTPTQSPGRATERAYSSRNIIASNFNQNRQSEQSKGSAKVKIISGLSKVEDDYSKRNPLSYHTMISEHDIIKQIIPFLRGFDLDDARNYAELSTDCFIQQIGDSYYCALCCQRIAKHHSLAHHMTHPKHVDIFLRLRSKLFNTTPRTDSLNMISLQHLMRTWTNESALTLTQFEERLAAVNDFNAILAETDPTCQCRIIGSLSTLTSLVGSDINLELIHPNNKLFQHDPRSKNSIHHKLVDPDAEYGNQINNHTMHFDMISNAVDTLYRIGTRVCRGFLSNRSFTLKRKDFCRDLSAKIPKLILNHESTNVRLEVWCYADSSFQLASLLRNYMSLDERVQQLSILVKYWAKICRISNPRRGTFTPDTLVILVIHFLQRVQPPILPCLHELFGKTDDKARKQTESVAEDSTKLDKANQHDSDSNDELAKTSGIDSELLENNIDVDDEVEEVDPDDELIDHDFDQQMIDGLNWKSENSDPVHKLFVDFLKFSMSEFANLSLVISIRTLKKIQVHDKKWNTQVKPIENPVRPNTNLSRNIGSLRTFEYIKQCFSYGYYYLTSIPLAEGLKRVAVPQPDPTGYIKLYFHLKRFEFYFNMKRQKIEDGSKGDFVDEMIQQLLFGRDVAVIKELVEYSILNNRKLDTIPSTVATCYDLRLLMPPDTDATFFCWLCRSFGHERSSCPKGEVLSIKETEIDPHIDRINFDGGFMELYLNDMIDSEVAEEHNKIVRELRDAIHSGTGLDCVLELFGSTVNLLGSIDSDLDICMTLKDNPDGRGVNCVRILKQTCEVLSQNEHVKNTIEPILSARVPIIKFKYDNFDVDLSMYNQCAIYNSKLLRSYVHIDYRVPQLYYLVKQYAKSCGIADASRGSLSSYAWSLMVIHFLQHTNPPILPVLQETVSSEPKPIVGVNGWNVWFNENFDPDSRTCNETTLTSLFKQFLLYYAEFDFTQYVISIRTSKWITKFKKNWTYCMMAIEDPFELTYNLSGRLDDPMALYIMNSFAKAYKHICSFQKDVRRRPNTPGADHLRLLFNGRAIMGCEPPFRGCRLCHRIGHRVKDCPEKVQQKFRDEVVYNRNAEPKWGSGMRKGRKGDNQTPRRPKSDQLSAPT